VISKLLAPDILSWRELTDLVPKYREAGWLFRGEPNPTYELLNPKVGRLSEESGSVRKTRFGFSESDEIRVLRDFKKAAVPYLTRQPTCDIEWLALAQHHGLPTRLLDWSDSLLVAAFFAVEKTSTNGGGVIWCVHGIPEIKERTEEGAEKGDDPFNLNEVKVFHPPHISPRMTVQRSVLTIHPNPTEDFVHPKLQRLVIEKTACWDIKRNLNAAGVSYSSLFPDLGGICQQIGWMYKWAFFTRNLPGTR